MNDGKVIP